MIDELRKIPIFFIRDFKMLFTYKLAFSVSFLGSIFNVLIMIIFGSMFGALYLTTINDYGGNFITYILIGAIGWGFLWIIMDITSKSVSREMMLGTLESILATPTKLKTLIFSYALFGSFFGILSMVILMLVGFAFFGVSVFSTANGFTVIVFILSAIMAMGLGMIFSGLTIWLKNIGDTVALIQGVTMFFCGVYFPISFLPGFFQPLARFIPFFYSMEGLRQSLIPINQGSSVIYYIIVLIVLAIVSICLGLFVLNKGLIKAKKDGSLMYY
jgi:ABC-2 type transport system permease protein